MTRLFSSIAAIALSAGAALAEKLPLNEISSYLNDLQTAQGEFTQINDDGSIDTGRIYIKRPGRMRFEYDPPSNALVVAGSGEVVVSDPKSNQGGDSYPLGRTPLSLILARDIDLGQARMVVGHDFDGTATVVTAQDPKNPEIGTIQIKFTADPVELRQWVINDSAGSQTTVVLGEMTTGGNLSNRLFDTRNVQPAQDR
ncbi:MAG: outer membrane lipoprotein carrier protein LolA [Pseudomonadota bacterium]